MKEKFSFDFRDKHCWSCEHYLTHREIVKVGFFSSERIEVEDTAICVNKKSTWNNGKKVSCNNKCSYHELCSLLVNEKIKQENEKEKKRIEAEQRQLRIEAETQRRELENEKRKLTKN